MVAGAIAASAAVASMTPKEKSMNMRSTVDRAQIPEEEIIDVKETVAQAVLNAPPNATMEQVAIKAATAAANGSTNVRG